MVEFIGVRHICSVTFSSSCALQWQRKSAELERRGATHTIKPPCRCPAVSLSSDPALVIEPHWLGWGREATIVRVTPFVNLHPPTLELTNVAEQQLTVKLLAWWQEGLPVLCGSNSYVADTLQRNSEATICTKEKARQANYNLREAGKTNMPFATLCFNAVIECLSLEQNPQWSANGKNGWN